MSRFTLAATAAAALALALPSAASADTFCVFTPAGCTGAAEPTIQAALDAADALPGRDEIQVGSHNGSPETIDIVPGNAVDVLAPSISQTEISVSSFTVREPSAVIKNLSFWGGSTTDPALDLGAATAENVRIGGPMSYTGGVVHLAGGTLKGATINGGQYGTGIVVDGAGGTIEGTGVVGWHGVISSGANLTLDHARISGDNAALRVTAGAVSLDTVTVTRMGPFVGGATSFGAFEVLPASPVTVVGRYVTVSGSTRTPSQGLLATCTASTADITLTDSLFAMNGVDLARSGAGCDVHLDHVGYETRDAGGGAFDDVAGVISGPMVPVAQRFWGNVPRPTFGTPAVDAGSATSVAPGAKDIVGRPRLRGSHVDLGAYEYQDTTPNFTLHTIDGPSNATVGAAVTFTASGPWLDEDGERFTYTWAVDGTTIGTGATITWTPAQAGNAALVLTVADEAGHSGVASGRWVAVAKKPVTPPVDPTTSTPTTSTPSTSNPPETGKPDPLPAVVPPVTNVFAGPAVSAKLTSAKLRDGVLRVAVTCGAGAPCKGSVVLKAGKVTLGKAKLDVKAGKVATVKVKVVAKVAKRAIAKGRRGTAVSVAVLQANGKKWVTGKGGKVTR